MKTVITFTWNPGLWAYDSDSDDPWGVGTKTGTYVLESEANERIKVLEDALKLTQFGFNHTHCPVCAGWNMSIFGSTAMAHTKECQVGKALEVKQ
jgi:hypothetical protein